MLAVLANVTCIMLCIVQHGVDKSVVMTQYNKFARDDYVTNSESYNEDTYDKERMVQPNVCKYLKN